jgi:hypothetical protein
VLEPWVCRAALDGDPGDVVTRVQHLNHGFDVLHLLARPFGLLPVLKYLAA